MVMNKVDDDGQEAYATKENGKVITRDTFLITHVKCAWEHLAYGAAKIGNLHSNS
jgi:hypothetical protein